MYLIRAKDKHSGRCHGLLVSECNSRLCDLGSLCCVLEQNTMPLSSQEYKNY